MDREALLELQSPYLFSLHSAQIWFDLLPGLLRDSNDGVSGTPGGRRLLKVCAAQTRGKNATLEFQISSILVKAPVAEHFLNPSRKRVANPVYGSIIPSGMLSPFFICKCIGVVRLSPDLHQVSLSYEWYVLSRTWIVQPDLWFWRFCLRRPYIGLAYIGDVFFGLVSGGQSKLSIVSYVTQRFSANTFISAKGMEALWAFTMTNLITVTSCIFTKRLHQLEIIKYSRRKRENRAPSRVLLLTRT